MTCAFFDLVWILHLYLSIPLSALHFQHIPLVPSHTVYSFILHAFALLPFTEYPSHLPSALSISLKMQPYLCSIFWTSHGQLTIVSVVLLLSFIHYRCRTGEQYFLFSLFSCISTPTRMQDKNFYSCCSQLPQSWCLWFGGYSRRLLSYQLMDRESKSINMMFSEVGVLFCFVSVGKRNKASHCEKWKRCG